MIHISYVQFSRLDGDDLDLVDRLSYIVDYLDKNFWLPKTSLWYSQAKNILKRPLAMKAAIDIQ